MSFTTDKLKSTRVYIAMGDGAAPEVFAPLCGITTKGFQQTRATSDTVDWDCNNPDAAPHVIRDMGAKDWSLSGSGLLARNKLAALQAAFDAGVSTNFKFVFDESASDTIVDGHYAGPGIITDLNITAENGNYIQISISISGADAVAFVAN